MLHSVLRFSICFISSFVLIVSPIMAEGNKDEDEASFFPKKTTETLMIQSLAGVAEVSLMYMLYEHIRFANTKTLKSKTAETATIQIEAALQEITSLNGEIKWLRKDRDDLLTDIRRMQDSVERVVNAERNGDRSSFTIRRGDDLRNSIQATRRNVEELLTEIEIKTRQLRELMESHRELLSLLEPSHNNPNKIPELVNELWEKNESLRKTILSERNLKILKGLKYISIAGELLILIDLTGRIIVWNRLDRDPTSISIIPAVEYIGYNYFDIGDGPEY